MRSISSLLQTEIDNGRISNCILITRKDGVKYGFTDNESNITVGSQVYHPAPGLQRLRLTTTANAEISNQEFGSAWVDVPDTDLKGGKLDNCFVQVYWVSWAHPEYGSLEVFSGYLGDIVWTDEGFKADVVSFMKNLEMIIGNTYTAQCRHQLFSSSKNGVIGFCGVNESGYSFTGSITSIITSKWKFGINVVQANKYFANGQITFTSGFNNGLSAVIKIHSSNEIELFLPTGFVVNVGDTFIIKAGCDKTKNTCKTKFNNIINFGGFPHIKPDINFR